jgi:hypothetical protein
MVYEAKAALAAISAYTGSTVESVKDVPAGAIQDMLVCLERTAREAGVRFDAYAAHIDYLGEAGLCLDCTSNPEATEEGEDWDWSYCPGFPEYPGAGMHLFDTLAEASIEWANKGIELGYAVRDYAGTGRPCRIVGPAFQAKNESPAAWAKRRQEQNNG